MYYSYIFVFALAGIVIIKLIHTPL